MLEGVGEDVNRIVGDKPYTELADGAGRPDAEVAAEAWAAHTARENHIVTALFGGQLRIKTHCTVTAEERDPAFEQFTSLQVKGTRPSP